MSVLRIFGIDTSGKIAAAALYDTEQACFLAQQAIYTKQTHSQVILPMAERLLSDVGLTIHNVDGFAVAKGPGSYTGLRIGIAAAQAMGFALGVPCAGVSTLEGLAWQNLAWRGAICAAMLARKNLYYAGFYSSDGAKVTAMQADCILEEATILEQVAAIGKPVLFAGDGAEHFAALDKGVATPDYGKLQNGTGICLAAGLGEHTIWQSPEQLQPAYLQAVTAEKDRFRGEK